MKVLSALVDADIPFVFDLYSSDTNTMGAAQKRFSQCHATFSVPEDALGYVSMQRSPTGDTENLNCLDYYLGRYGRHFAGVRIFEVGSMHWEHWVETVCKLSRRHPSAYSWSLTREIVRFAHDHGLFVVFTDNKWHNPYERFEPTCDSWPPLRLLRQDLVALAAEFPNSIHLGYSNNEGVRDHDGYYSHNYRLRNWQRGLDRSSDFRGFALSNQTWMTDGHRFLFDETLPPQEFAVWTMDAFDKGASLVQLEPFYYMFEWDRMSILDWESAKDLEETPWSEAGRPTDALRKFADLLGVDLRGL